MSVIIRSDGGQPAALTFIAPEALEEMAGNGHAEHPKRVNGHRYGPPCPHRGEDSRD